MERFVGLFRGINVGGNHKVDMKTLKSVMENDDYIDVKTYINSGNVIFRSNILKTDVHQKRLEELLRKHFDVESKVLVLTKNHFNEIACMIPKHFENDDSFKADVLFYFDEITSLDIDSIPINKGFVETVYLNKALICGVNRTDQGKSGLDKIVGKKVYQLLTIRNVNTVRKIQALLE